MQTLGAQLMDEDYQVHWPFELPGYIPESHQYTNCCTEADIWTPVFHIGGIQRNLCPMFELMDLYDFDSDSSSEGESRFANMSETDQEVLLEDRIDTFLSL